MIYARMIISSTERLNMISNLATMLSAGIPIISAINSLSEEARGNVKKILVEMHSDLLRGKHLYESMAKFPSVFDSVTVNMIRASEESGTLDVVLKDLKEQLKKDMALNRKIRNALTYPFLVLVVFFGVLLLILTVVMPKISTVFSQLKVPLPLPTKILIFSSNLLIHQTIYVLLGIALVVAGASIFYYFQKNRVMKVLYSLPGVSAVVRDVDLIRFTRSIHLLLNAGTSITAALELCQHVILQSKTAKAVAHARQSVLAGKTLSSSFKQHRHIFPGTMIELTQAGERTGSLDRSMQDISEYLDNKVSDNLSVLTALLEPVMLVVVAILVGSMMVAIIGPIYGLIGQISPH